MKPISEKIKENPWLGWLLFFTSMAVVFLLGLLASSIIERRTEAIFAFSPQVEYDKWEPRNEVWGLNFPKQYQSLMQTIDTNFFSKYNGNGNIDMLEVDPRLVILWAGYGFSKDYLQSKGHAYSVTDLWSSLRTGAPKNENDGPMPATCWTCKSPDVPRLMHKIGIEEFYKGKWAGKGHEIVNSIGCADCHDAQTMNLQISRPALIEAFERMGKDITKASHQEMRSLVCAQCHVEYYFKRKGKYLTFPWDKGLRAEDMEAYYDEIEFSDWTHKISGAPMIKAQHPGYEMYQTGVHADRGVSCADCHMPYKSEGGLKYTDHKVQSPLNNVANSCQVCHREETAKLIANVYERQDKIIENRDKLEELLVRAHIETCFALDKGADEKLIKPVQILIRHAQWRWDFAAAAHGNSFHSPLETGRIISTGIVKAQEARIQLARILASLGYFEEVPYPDISTKDKAQIYIGLDIKKLRKEKNEFLQTMVPEWLKKAKEREAGYNVKENN